LQELRVEFDQAPPSKIGERLVQEVKQMESEEEQSVLKKLRPPSSTRPQQGTAEEEPPRLPEQTLLTRAFVAESLVFQELQSEFKTPVQRNVGFGLRGSSFIADGVIEAPDATYVVETKLVRGALHHKRRIIEAKHQISRYREQMKGWPRRVRFILAIVLDSGTEELAANIASGESDSGDLIMRVYFLDQLARKYGLAPP